MTRLDAIQVHRGAALILALASLTEKERQIVVAHAYRGLSLEQAAREAGLKYRQNAEWRYKRALVKLAGALEGDRELLLETVA